MSFYSCRALAAWALLLAVGCAQRDRAGSPSASPPPAEFLLATQDSTFWVSTNGRTLHARGAPLTLAHYDGRFYEVFLADDDRSYRDALLVGLRVYRRDLLQGDSAVVFEDTIVPRLAREYAKAHPGARVLRPDEDGNEDPSTQAMADLQVVDVHGPYLSFEYHVDVSKRGTNPWHTTRRGVIDLRSGRSATVADLFSVGIAAALIDSGRHELASAIDSLRDDSRESARRAVVALSRSRFDERSFVLTVPDTEVAVEFDVPLRGASVPDDVIPLDPLRPPPPDWWREIATRFARSEDDLDRWPRASAAGYDVLARYDSSAEKARISISDGTHEWPVRVVAAPILHLLWLDRSPIDSSTRRALSRAFDEAALYDEATRTVRNASRPPPHPRARFITQRLRPSYLTRHRA
jgi:hypothetical protein